MRIRDPLPRAKQYAATSGTHENTVLRAYRTLRSEGIIDLRRSRGAVVIAAPDYSTLNVLIAHLVTRA